MLSEEKWTFTTWENLGTIFTHFFLPSLRLKSQASTVYLLSCKGVCLFSVKETVGKDLHLLSRFQEISHHDAAGIQLVNR